jgi:hypothetical protein
MPECGISIRGPVETEVPTNGFCYFRAVADDAELRALTESIGEHAVSLFGKENLAALSVTLDTIDLTATVSVAVRDESMAATHEVADQFAELEELFLAEAVLRLRFVDAPAIQSAPLSSQPRFAMA